MADKFYNSPISLTSQFYFCPVPLRLDTYSGCSHKCVYCFANNSDMKFINNDKFQETAREFTGVKPTKLAYIKKYFDIAFEGAKNTFNNQEALAVECLKKRVPMHFGGMSDGFQPIEAQIGITYETLKLLKKYNYPIILSTKGKLIAEPKYFNLLKDYENLALQISLIDYREEVIKALEPKAATVQERLDIIKQYSSIGKWVACRIQPLIINLQDNHLVITELLNRLQAAGCKHVMVEGLKFFSGNKLANKRIAEVFKTLTGNEYDLEAYYKAIGSKNSGNDLELPSWRKHRYVKIFAEELKKRGMTFGCADNDLRFMGDSPCCCGVEGLKGFENMLKHNTGFAVFNALRNNKKEITYDDIKDEWFPKGDFRLVMSNEKAQKLFGDDKENPTSNRDIMELFMKAWNKGDKNSPCDMCCVKYNGCGKYCLKSQDLIAKELGERGEQKTL